MSAKTAIEWTDQTWNPLAAFLKRDVRIRVGADEWRTVPAGTRGWFCTKCSPGCAHCYAEKINIRLGNGLEYTLRNLDEIEFRLVNLNDPFHWRKPQMVFVNSMTDLFHEAVPDELILSVFRVMKRASNHVFQVLTKRADRMRDFMRRVGQEDGELFLDHLMGGMAPHLDHVWLGVSVENQKFADERIPLLLETPAAVRFLSCEPLLGPVDLCKGCPGCPNDCGWTPGKNDYGIHWVIVGGESGPGARPMHPDWARSLRDQCYAAGVRFFFKQWGEFRPTAGFDPGKEFFVHRESGKFFPNSVDGAIAARGLRDFYVMARVGKKKAGRVLDGHEWNEFPSPLRTAAATTAEVAR